MSSHVLRFAYFGLPLGALALVRAGFVPHVVVLGRTEALGTRRLRRVLATRATLFTAPAPDDPRIEQALRDQRVEAILSWFYPKQIPQTLLRCASRGAFGAHPSLLPRWRGPDPTFWAIYAGDHETGVSLHRLEADYDTGAVIEQARLPIAPTEHALALARRLDRPGLALMITCARRLADGERLEGTPQNERAATPAPAPDEDLLEIDWRRPAAEIVRLVRAAAPFPGASTQLGDALVDVVEASESKLALPGALEPADAVWTPVGLVVRAGDGGVHVTRVRHDDGSLLRGEALIDLFRDGIARIGFENREANRSSGKTDG